MNDTILAAVGGAAALWGLVMLIRVILFERGGTRCMGEIISAETDKRGRYVHTVRYTAEDGREMTAKDRAGYSQSLGIGTKKAIICGKSGIRFVDELKIYKIAYGLFTGVGALFLLRLL